MTDNTKSKKPTIVLNNGSTIKSYGTGWQYTCHVEGVSKKTGEPVTRVKYSYHGHLDKALEMHLEETLLNYRGTVEGIIGAIKDCKKSIQVALGSMNG